MKMWQVVLAVLATLASSSALTVGPVTLPNNNRFINFTKGASPDNSLLSCDFELGAGEELSRVSWELIVDGANVGTFDWEGPGASKAGGRLQGVVNLGRNDGALQLTELRYDLSGEYSCRAVASNGEEAATAPWEVLIVDSVSHRSTLHTKITNCSYTTSYSTLAMFPKPEVRAGLYSISTGGFYDEIPKTSWRTVNHDNGSVTYSYSDFTFQLDSRTPEDVSFLVNVGVMKADGNFIPVSSAKDEHLILHHLGCPEPRLEEYQHIKYHRDTITCRGEHKDTEATVTCKEGYHADGNRDEVLVRCEESTHKWVLEDGTQARREHLGCVINRASSAASIPAALLGVALVLLRLSVP
ncbi:uncharacterized protein LOC127000205 isoform X2 [Eriocheir sinensis]|uniref:uncharacterized protein LOC127000205 isoform X2 n=1 Tax=Eriocheir sinensis TaxID=95602 RepID=UPI0021C7C246|nr:uncharacterized protein LOC127000205 isoform X2 [Eriocheir sinensis]